ncbi:MerR family transcriptional regulator [Paenibacillus sp. D2_2]|uniref:MerR family transcriptional regulator n=1 Tax=Paenibacillus sp. D2_2 TaxID=3073092 RepID=UPI0028156E21|nr:MerR family transcriptional regulator [Paenibacillus sp. D2_2]WMT41190.1 MerR family transcriptional regulator [Paenibacillus sp. D2_2]
MRTVKQVSLLTGVSVRALQFYDEIGLLRPTRVNDAGYRLYDDDLLEKLQQILFFKELDFTLSEIKAFMDNPQFDKKSVFEKQRGLIQMKCDRLNALLGLLDKLIKGEKCMDFKDFDMSDYFRVMANFKRTHTDEIIKQLGSIEDFDSIFLKMNDNEAEITKMAIKEYGSVENYTKAMEKNFEKFLSGKLLPPKSEVDDLIEKGESITKRLTADLSKDIASSDIQGIVSEMVSFTDDVNRGIDVGDSYWPFMVETYLSNPVFTEATDKKYGQGAARFIGLALKEYLDNHHL